MLVAMLMLGATSDSHANDRPRAADLVAEIMAHLGFDASHKQALLKGEILFTGMPDLEPMPQAVAVAGAMLVIQRPWTELIDAYLSEETLRVQSDVLAFGTMPEQGGDIGVLEGLSFDDEQQELRRLLRVSVVVGNQGSKRSAVACRLALLGISGDLSIKVGHTNMFKDRLATSDLMDACRTTLIFHLRPPVSRQQAPLIDRLRKCGREREMCRSPCPKQRRWHGP